MARDEPSVRILRKIVLDGFLLIFLSLCLAAIHYAWKPFQRGFFCNDETLMFPYRDDTVNVLMLRSIGIGMPLLAIVICEWVLLREDADGPRCLGFRLPAWLRGIYCAALSFGLGYFFVELTTQIAKKTIGRPRPHFFDVCQPSVDCSSPAWTSRYIQPQDYTCTGSRTHMFTDMRMSFLSGHSSTAAYAMIYLALYLEHRMTWRGSRVLRHILQFTAVMLSWYTALSRVSDYKHHWSDVLAGYSLGLVLAVLTWIWGTDLVQKKKNHIPLSQHELAPPPQTVQT